MGMLKIHWIYWRLRRCWQSRLSKSFRFCDRTFYA